MSVELPSSVDESPITLVGKIVAIFLIVGAGIGGATLIFLSATGVFDVAASDDLEALGRQFLGGIALATVLVFGLLIGIVLAALGGLYAANRSSDRGISAAVGGIAGTLGHVALVFALGVFLIVGVEALQPSESEATPTPTPIATQSAEDIATCVEIFGAGSEQCTNEATDESTADESSGVSFEDIWRIGLGLIPAAGVGALSGALGFTRRSTVIADVPVLESRRPRFEPPTVRVTEPPLRRAKSSPRKAKPKPTTRKPVTRRRPTKPDDLTEERSDDSTDRPSDDLTVDHPELPPD